MEYPKKMTELYECFFRVCEKHQIYNPEVVANDLLLAFCAQEGGVRNYYPKPDALIRPLRNEAITLNFSGNNMKALAKQYGVSDQTIRNILHQQKPKKETDQIPLF